MIPETENPQEAKKDCLRLIRVDTSRNVGFLAGRLSSGMKAVYNPD